MEALISLALVVALFVVLGSGLWIGLSLLAVALVGMELFTQRPVGDSMMLTIWGSTSSWTLTALPLFLWMGEILFRSKLSDDMFKGLAPWLDRLPGRLLHTNVVGCTIFAAISGSSVATALTIGAVAIPQMVRYGYEPKAAYGLVAAGGTLGILIPPSGPMVLYGVTTDTSIGGLFMAGVVPGLLMAAVFIAWSMTSTAIAHRHIPREARASLREALVAIRKALWALSLPVFVLGGMYAGMFTATEAAAAGAWLALLVAVLIYRTVRLRAIWDSAVDACRVSAMLFMILAGASVFGHVLTKMRIPQQIVETVIAADIGVAGFLIVMMALIFVLGMFLESISIILITTPVIMPAMAHLQINPIWYGVLLVINLELAQITPPVGMNLFTIKAITGSPMGPIVRGAAPYVGLMVLVLAMIMIWPQIALWLPSTMLAK